MFAYTARNNDGKRLHDKCIDMGDEVTINNADCESVDSKLMLLRRLEDDRRCASASRWCGIHQGGVKKPINRMFVGGEGRICENSAL